MDPKTACKIIAEIEQRFDVNSVRYKNLEIWPLIRLMLRDQLFDTKTRVAELSPDTNVLISSQTRLVRLAKDPWRMARAALSAPPRIGRATATYLSSQRSHRQQLSQLRQATSVDILFFSRSVEYVNQFDGKFYDPSLDPWIDLVRDQYSFLKLELGNPGVKTTLPRFESTIFIDPSYYLTCRRLLRGLRLRRETAPIERFADLQQVIFEVTGHRLLNERGIVTQAQQLEQFQAFFTEVLSLLRPKAVFLVCYYYVVGMALIRACRQAEVTTVDIQHGAQNKYHGFYNPWTKIPASGYELLPDFFWNWGQISKQNIQTWQPPGCSHHQPIVGGNLWLAKWVEGNGYDTDSETTTFLERLRYPDRVILVSISFPKDDPLPALVLEAMQRSPKSWLWLIRLHPQWRNHRMASPDQLRTLIERRGIQNFEIDNSSRCPLPALLKQCHHHVTCLSSVCYEALVFNVPTTIVHPEGLQVHGEYISQGVFTYAQNSDELLAAIDRVHTKEQLRESVPYIETSRQCAEEALSIIMRGLE